MSNKIKPRRKKIILNNPVNINNSSISEQKWEELNDIYLSIANGIVSIADSINTSIIYLKQIQELCSKELIDTVNGVNRDINLFTNDLIKIKKRHEGFQGYIKDENELALCLSIYNDYVILNERFKAIIFHPMLTVTEYLNNIKIDIDKGNENGNN
jgi:hypothetical protein